MEKNFFPSKSPDNTKRKIYLLLGAPFSGKNQILSEIKNFPKVYHSTRVIKVEQLLLHDSKARSFLDSNLDVPDELVVKIIGKHLKENISSDLNIIIPDFPKSINELELLLRTNTNVQLIKFDIKFMDVLKKYTSSTFCAKCKGYYLLPEENKCPKCGGILSKKPAIALTETHKNLSDFMIRAQGILDFAKDRGIPVQSINTTTVNANTILEFYSKL